MFISLFNMFIVSSYGLSTIQKAKIFSSAEAYMINVVKFFEGGI